MTQPDLFGEQHTERPEDGLSQGRRLTLRQHQMVERGIHPLTGGPVSTDGRLTCGGCAHRQHEGHHDRTYAKCHNTDTPPISRGPATDVRAWWPGCQFHRPAESGEPA